MRGVLCPSCGHDHVSCYDTRHPEGVARRRRKCLSCGHRWTTYEVDKAEYEIMRRWRDLQIMIGKWVEDAAPPIP